MKMEADMIFGRIKIYGLMVLLICISGCLFDSKKEIWDKGTYTLITKDMEITSYPDGGGLFIISMTPSGDFKGKLRLSILADPLLKTNLTTNILTLEEHVAEIEIRPDTSIPLKKYDLKLLSMHANLTDSLNLLINVVKPDTISSYKYAKKNFDIFILFIQNSHLEWNVTNIDWFYFNHYPHIRPGGPCEWTFLNDRWDIHVYAPTWPLGQPVWCSLRKRDEIEPIFASFKDMNTQIHEIPVNEFGLTH
jgi:hypothetical protein